MDALYYKSHLYKDWMRRWQAAHPDVLHVILDDIGSMGGKQLDERGSQILVSIAYKTREARVGMRSARSFAEKLLAAVTDAVPFVWVPIGLRAMGDDKHANALWIDLRELYGGDGVVHIWHYEPHGGDAQDRRHDGCGFTNYYNTSTYSASMCEFLHRAVTEGGLPFACVYHAPSSWEPPVFAQSVSDVKGRGKGDGWCAFHCFWFLLAATKDGGVEPFVARIQEGVRRNTLRDTVLANLRELAETQHIVDP